MPLTRDEQSPRAATREATGGAAPDGPAAHAPGQAEGRPGAASGGRPGRSAFRRDWQLYSLALLPLIFFAIFKYGPMIGNVIAFRRFRPGGSIFGDEWVGVRYIEMFINDPSFWHVFSNTAILGGTDHGGLLPAADRARAPAERGAEDGTSRSSCSRSPTCRTSCPIVIIVGMVMQLLVAARARSNQIVGAFGGEEHPVPPAPRVVPHHLRRIRSVADRSAGAPSSTWRRSPRSTTPSTRRRRSTARAGCARPGTSRCRASARP